MLKRLTKSTENSTEDTTQMSARRVLSVPLLSPSILTPGSLLLSTTSPPSSHVFFLLVSGFVTFVCVPGVF